jgi:hypothetical protein
VYVLKREREKKTSKKREIKEDERKKNWRMKKNVMHVPVYI